MKKLLFLSFILLSTISSFAQCPTTIITLTTQAEVDAFAVTYPGCTQLTSRLLISGADISDLSSLSIITGLDGLRIENNPILQNLNGLENVSSLTEWTFSIRNNSQLVSISSLSNMIASGTEILIENNPLLSSLDGLQGITGFIVDFSIENNDSLINLAGADNITGAEFFYILGNDALIDLSGFNNFYSAVSIFVIDSNASLQTIENINIEIYLGQFIVTGNNVLTSINVFDQWTDDTCPGFDFIEIIGNPNLAICNNNYICSMWDCGPEVIISDNAIGCNDVLEVVLLCNDTNLVTGNVKFDFNLDGCDTLDYNANSLLIEITDGANVFTTVTDSLGNFIKGVNLEGTFDVQIVSEALPLFFESSPITESVTFVGFGNQEQVDFCLTSSGIINDLKITLLTLNDARPGFDAYYQIVYENVGTTVLSGDVNLIFDDARQTFLNATPLEDAISGNTITWSYNDLIPFQSRTINVSFNNFTPPTNENGDILVFEATINPVTGDENPLDNVYNLEQIMVNSQDPNDKQVMQGEEIFEAEVGAYLDYLIRFQNMGTADAINVRVDDLLSDNLDWNTFRMLSSSHDYRVEIANGNEVSFIFENINLPPESTDPEGSNGYITFQIKSKSDLNIGDSVANFANIYFDFNAPIITNTVVTTVVENLGVSEVDLYNSVSLIPNPVSEILTISVSENISINEVTVYSMLGIKLIETSNNHLDFSNFQQGIYFVTIETNQGNIIKRIIKE